jgi:ATP-dependent Lon protease
MFGRKARRPPRWDNTVPRHADLITMAKSNPTTRARTNADRASKVAKTDVADRLGVDAPDLNEATPAAHMTASVDHARYAAVTDLSAVLRQIETAYGRNYYGDNDAEYGFSPPNLPSDEQARIDRLRAIYHDPRGPLRPLLFGSDEIRERLAAVRRACPAFTALVDLVDRCVALSQVTDSPVSIPPLLIAGPPGIGKTHFAKALAAALGVALHPLQFSTMSDAQQMIAGHPTSWRGARMGVMTEALFEGDTASPVFLGDEIDKFVTHWSEQPYNVLLNVLEPENSRALYDEYLRVPFDLSSSIFVATANDVALLPPFIIDRLLVFTVAPPTGEQLMAVTQLICAAAVADLRNAVLAPADDVLKRLARANPRRIARIVRLAFAYAATAGRDHIVIADVDAAEALAGGPAARTPIGFLTPISGTACQKREEKVHDRHDDEQGRKRLRERE